ncbi:TonB-dependent siderophore receptor [Chitinophaga solisilvae]|uniref:TonB-dependent siderophore receptor n=1 Tax=Chitinophaga solisilvae TaxID=1233460 RepID=UPI00136E86DE|nr:TonB-dependent siderophore receptor [Chitinophaga solisilvae]
MKKEVRFLLLFLIMASSVCAQQQPDSIRRMRLREVEVQEKKKRLRADSIPAGLRLEGSLIETPQNIVSVSSALVAEQGGLVMKDIVRNASGVHMGYNTNLFDGSATIFIRGFPAPTYVNGLLQRTTIDDAAIIEQVEFIKGPAGFLASAGEPGGTVNITTKVPLQRRVRSVEIAGGSFGMWRASVDLGSMIKTKGFSWRMNAAYQQERSFLDFLQTKKYVLAPVVQYNFSPRTSVLLEYNLLRASSAGGSGLNKVGTDEEIRHARIADNFAGDPGLPGSYGETQSVRFLFNHALSKSWKLVAQGRYTSTPAETWYLFSANQSPVNFINDTTRRLPVRNHSTGQVVASQLYVKGVFNTGTAIRHYLMTGVDFNYARDVYNYTTGQYSFYFDRRQPVYGLHTDSVRMLKAAADQVDENNWASAYAYDMIHVGEAWRINIGGRYTRNTRPGKELQQAFSPRLGITWLLRSNLSVYALYDQSFIPQTGSDFDKNLFKPLLGNDFELGVKGDWFNKRLSTTVTGYRIIKNNMLVADPEHRRFRKQIGQVKSTGVEVDVMGQITDRFTVSANYSYTDAVISKDTKPANVGTALPFMPQQNINTWLQYSIPVSTARLRLSLGQRTAIRPGTYTPDLYLPDYTLFDAGASWDAGKWYVRIVAENITNRRYFSSGDILIGSVYPDVKTTYYIDGTPINFKAFAGIRW